MEKQASEVILSRTLNNRSHFHITFNKGNIKKFLYQWHLGIVLDLKVDLKFQVH